MQYFSCGEIFVCRARSFPDPRQVHAQEIKRQTQGVARHSHCRIQCDDECDRGSAQRSVQPQKYQEWGEIKQSRTQVSFPWLSGIMETAKKGRAKSTKWNYVPEVVGKQNAERVL